MKIIIAILLCMSLLFGMSACGKKDAPTPEKTLGLGEEYLDDGDYEKALEQFLNYIDLEPKDEYGYVCAADAYIGMEKNDKAIDILEKGLDKIDSNSIDEKLNALRASAEPAAAAFVPEEQPIEPELAETTILTVSAINFSGMSQISSIDFTDESGAPVSMPTDWNEWFENATVSMVTLTGTLSMQINSSGGNDYSLGDGSMIQFIFVADGKNYPIGVCVGAQFAVEKTEGGYILLPEETTLMSPPPPAAEGTDDSADEGSGNTSFDEWFKYGGWTGISIELTARKDVTITGYSVFSGGEEHKGYDISNSSGDMALQGGITVSPGSTLRLASGPITIYAGTKVSCDIFSVYDEPEQLCIYLESGETLTKDL